MAQQDQAYCDRMKDLRLTQMNRASALEPMIWRAERSLRDALERVRDLEENLTRAERQKIAAALAGTAGGRIGGRFPSATGAATQSYLATQATLEVERFRSELDAAKREVTRNEERLENLLKEQRDVVGNLRTTEADIQRNCSG